MNCPGQDKCPYRKPKPIATRENLAVLLALVFIGVSWFLTVRIEHRAPTMFELGFAVTSLAALSVKPIYFFALIKRVVK